ncbi:MAG: ABC transporter substrate-binding protein [Pseudomonadota bacterium]
MKRLKKSLFLLTILAMAWSMGIAAAGAETVIRLGILPVVDVLPLLAAEEEGLFAEQGIKLELVSFQSALERDAALQADRLDGYFGDLLNTLLLIGSGRKLGIVTQAYHTNPRRRMFGLAVSEKSGITDLAGMKGKKTAISRATVIEYVLDSILAAEGFDADYVVKEEIKKIPIRLQMLLANQVDAALLPEPLLSLAELKGAKVVADDRLADMTLTVIALDRSLREKTPDVTARFAAAYKEAVRRINAAPDKYLGLLVAKTSFPKPLEKTYEMPIFPAWSQPSARDVDHVQDWLARNGIIKARLSLADVVMD